MPGRGNRAASRGIPALRVHAEKLLVRVIIAHPQRQGQVRRRDRLQQIRRLDVHAAHGVQRSQVDACLLRPLRIAHLPGQFHILLHECGGRVRQILLVFFEQPGVCIIPLLRRHARQGQQAFQFGNALLLLRHIDLFLVQRGIQHPQHRVKLRPQPVRNGKQRGRATQNRYQQKCVLAHTNFVLEDVSFLENRFPQK